MDVGLQFNLDGIYSAFVMKIHSAIFFFGLLYVFRKNSIQICKLLPSVAKAQKCFCKTLVALTMHWQLHFGSFKLEQLDNEKSSIFCCTINSTPSYVVSTYELFRVYL